MINLKSIWDNQIPQGENLIKTKIDAVQNFDCFAATNHITGNHIFIFEINLNTIIPEFKTKKFKGVTLEIFEFDDKFELQIFLLDNDLKDIFCYLIEDIVESVITAITQNEALVKISNVILKWKKLFDKITNKGLTIEQQKGLIGELLFIELLLENNFDRTQILEIWTGPEFEDKDFMFGETAVEVKLSSSKIPKIQISNERQLDSKGLKKLFLSHVLLDEVKGAGFNLNEIVERVKIQFSEDHYRLLQFIDKLAIVGYFSDDYELYDSNYQIREIKYYNVSNDFPKIISENLEPGIFNVSFFIEPIAIENYSLTTDSLLQSLQIWKENY
jgi:hypothetical protein